MPRTWLSFAAGVIVTAALFYFWDARGPIPDPAIDEPVIRESAPEGLPRGEAIQETAIGTDTTESAPEVSASAATDEEPPFAMNSSIATWVPPEFHWLSSNPRFRGPDGEAIDPGWSARTESEINGYIADRPAIYSKYGFPTVRCRAENCYMFVVAYDTSEASLLSEFRELLSDYSDESWADQFEFGTAGTNSEGRVTTMLWELRGARLRE